MRIITARVAARFLVSFRNSLTPLVGYDTLRRQLYCWRHSQWQQKKSCLLLDLPSVLLRTVLSLLLRSAANRWLKTCCIIQFPPRIPDPDEFISEQTFFKLEDHILVFGSRRSSRHRPAWRLKTLLCPSRGTWDHNRPIFLFIYTVWIMQLTWKDFGCCTVEKQLQVVLPAAIRFNERMKSHLQFEELTIKVTLRTHYNYHQFFKRRGTNLVPWRLTWVSKKGSSRCKHGSDAALSAWTRHGTHLSTSRALALEQLSAQLPDVWRRRPAAFTSSESPVFYIISDELLILGWPMPHASLVDLWTPVCPPSLTKF